MLTIMLWTWTILNILIACASSRAIIVREVNMIRQLETNVLFFCSISHSRCSLDSDESIWFDQWWILTVFLKRLCDIFFCGKINTKDAVCIRFIVIKCHVIRCGSLLFGQFTQNSKNVFMKISIHPYIQRVLLWGIRCVFLQHDLFRGEEHCFTLVVKVKDPFKSITLKSQISITIFKRSMISPVF